MPMPMDETDRPVDPNGLVCIFLLSPHALFTHPFAKILAKRFDSLND
jgi:hypothetical protein